MTRVPSYEEKIAAIQSGQCAETYTLEHSVSMHKDGSAACDLAFKEMTPLLLGASYLSGLSVTANASLPSSEVMILCPSNHWPRARSMGYENAILDTPCQFKSGLEAFVKAWPVSGHDEKVLLLTHHWLDSMSCWSLEDLYLSATTLLQIIAATQVSIEKVKMSYFDGVRNAARRVGIRVLSRDFVDMRNNLVHEGTLIGSRSHRKSPAQCATVAADVLNWFDEYMHSILGLGPVIRQRFDHHKLLSLNAYSIFD